MPRTIRVPSFTDLSKPRQATALITSLRQVQNETQRTRMNVESPRQREEGRRELSPRFRVVAKPGAPGDPNFGTNEVHFQVGGKWMRVKLEEI